MLWRNPIFLRFCHAELRARKAAFWCLLTLIVTAFTVAITFVPQVLREVPAEEAARSAFFPLLVIQGILLLFLGTGSVATGIAREKVDQVLDYQRLTPLPVWRKLTGYLFGLPVRDYVLFLITVPFLVFVLVVGNIPASAFVPYYLVFFSSALLYHLTGMVAGMVSKRWRWSARISQGLIILLYFVLPQLSHFGLVFLEFLTVRPVFMEKIVPLIGQEKGNEVVEMGLFAGQAVPFFGVVISGTVFSLLLQVLLIALFAAISTRKWKAESVPAISKVLALAVFGSFAFISLANLWPTLNGDPGALRLFQADTNLSLQLSWAAIPIIMTMVTTFLGFGLLASAVPDPERRRLGELRRVRLGLSALPRWDDAAPGRLVLLGLGGIQALLLAAIYGTLAASHADELSRLRLWAIPVMMGAGFLNLAHFRGIKETYDGSRLGLFLLLGWLLPILGAILIVAANTEYGPVAIYVAVLSPLSLLPLAGLHVLPAEQFNAYAGTMANALLLGFALLALFNFALLLRLRKQGRHLSTK